MFLEHNCHTILWVWNRHSPFAQRKCTFHVPLSLTQCYWDTLINKFCTDCLRSLVQHQSNPQTSHYVSMTSPGRPLFSAGTYHRKQFSWQCAKWIRCISLLSPCCVASAGLTGVISSEKWSFTTKVSSCDSEYIKAIAFLS